MVVSDRPCNRARNDDVTQPLKCPCCLNSCARSNPPLCLTQRTKPAVIKMAPPTPKTVAPQKDNFVEAKLAKRFQTIVELRRKHPEPIRVPCDAILTHPRNRQGHAPNVQYIHKSLVPNLISQGFDPQRPHDGFLVELQNDSFKEEVLKFNKDFASNQNGVFPPIFDSSVKYACLGGNHLTIALRLFKHQVTSSITGQQIRASPEDAELSQVLTLGHKYIILDSSVTNEEAELISRWLNSDQDQNQASGTAMLLRTLTDIVKKEKESCSQIKVSNVISKFSSQSCLKIPTNTLGSLSRWVIEMGADDYCEEFLSFHSEAVNPLTLSVAPGWFEELTKARVMASILCIHVLLEERPVEY